MLDSESGSLLHAPPDSAHRSNRRFVTQDDLLNWSGVGADVPASRHPDGESRGKISGLEIIRIDDRRFHLRRAGVFLCAEPDGRILEDRGRASHWETFYWRDAGSETSGTIVTHSIRGKRVRFFIKDRRDHIQSHHLRGEFYEENILGVLTRYCAAGRAMLDIGANIGNHSIYTSMFTGIENIIVIEPNPAAIELLRINVALNGCGNIDTRFLGFGLGREAGRFSVVVPALDNLGSATLLEESSGEIEVLRGDDLLASEPIGLIKIDVEGMEFDVLAGLERTISRWRPNIFIEVWDKSRDRLSAWCSENNYKEILSEWDNFLLVPI